jgi:hypothetical protein
MPSNKTERLRVMSPWTELTSCARWPRATRCPRDRFTTRQVGIAITRLEAMTDGKSMQVLWG